MDIETLAAQAIKNYMTAKKTGMSENTFNRYKKYLEETAAQIPAQPDMVMLAYMDGWLADYIYQSVAPMPQIQMFEIFKPQKSLF